MKKLAILTLILLFLLVLSSVAFAGGWHIIGPDHAPDEGKWGIPGNVPHRNLQTSSNNCKVCHAVHDANSDSFKLLHDNSRATECNYCHDATSGVTSKKPYGITTDPYGEHTLGATTIPESDVVNSIQTDGLSCGNCHSVHDAWTLNDPSTGTLAGKLLRRDPANNDNDALGGIQNVANYGSTVPVLGDEPDAYDQDEAIAAFCGDCHNKNVNWDRGGSGSEGDSVPPASEGERPNGNAHPIGDVDGLIDIYGKLKNVSSIGRTYTCTSCHVSKGESESSFPHQSRGHKLFGATYRDASPIVGYNYTGDPYRVLPNLDAKVCRGCHSEIGKPGDSSSF